MSLLSLALALANLFILSDKQPLSIDQNNYHDLRLAVLDEEVVEMSTTGKDPHIFTVPLQAPLDTANTVLSFSYFCPTGLDFLQIHFLSLGKDSTTTMVRDIGSTEGWVAFAIDVGEPVSRWGSPGDYLRLDLGSATDINIQLKDLALRTYSNRERQLLAEKKEKARQEEQLETAITQYLSQEYPAVISEVYVMNDKIRLRGQSSYQGKVFLEPVSTYESVTTKENFGLERRVPVTEGAFEVKVNRYAPQDGFQQDRALAKWVLVDEAGTLLSPARYADTIAARYQYEFVRPRSKKGLGGYSAHRDAPVADLDRLGIASVTVNIWINRFFRSQPAPENMPFTYQGRTYYVDREAVEQYDQTLRSTAARDIEVSAILLVAKASESVDPEIGRILQHPDCDPAGIYSMPNLTTPEGVQYYAAVLDFLAARYSRPDKKYGRIHHWIIHNEVDAGWVWTNAGDKTKLVFMDIYHKSMRLMYNIARTYTPHSKVFISLTHYWSWTSNPHFYHAKDLLEILLDYSRAEGDFEWAIAHHPYPESLREPKTWLDQKVSYDFGTKLITFKNIEVLDAWVKQPEVLYRGKHKRTVYLSENGTNSPTYREQDLTEQAAGMAYAWVKIEDLDGIDGFQYHNWQDNRNEGGLRIGLRRFPDDEEKPGAAKPVWYIYAAAGTPQQAEVFAPYLPVIGIEQWEQVKDAVVDTRPVKPLEAEGQ